MRTTVLSRLSSPSPRAAERRHGLAPALLAVAAVLGTSGCSSWNPDSPQTRRLISYVVPYKADIVQGNVITTEQISQVKPGMTKLQVREILGTPLVTDPFHAQRWD